MKCLLLLLLTLPLFGSSQVGKFRAKYSSVVLYDSAGKYVSNDLSGPCDILVVVNGDKRKIKVYDSNGYEYDVATLDASYDDKSGCKWFWFSVVDDKGRDLKIRFASYKTQRLGYDACLYVDYPHATFVYKLVDGF